MYHKDSTEVQDQTRTAGDTRHDRRRTNEGEPEGQRGIHSVFQLPPLTAPTETAIESKSLQNTTRTKTLISEYSPDWQQGVSPDYRTYSRQVSIKSYLRRRWVKVYLWVLLCSPETSYTMALVKLASQHNLLHKERFLWFVYNFHVYHKKGVQNRIKFETNSSLRHFNKDILLFFIRFTILQ